LGGHIVVAVTIVAGTYIHTYIHTFIYLFNDMISLTWRRLELSIVQKLAVAKPVAVSKCSIEATSIMNGSVGVGERIIAFRPACQSICQSINQSINHDALS